MGDICLWLRRHPGLAIALAGATVVSGYLVYRAVLCGLFARGELRLAGTQPYQVTPYDMLQLGRAVVGEVTESTVAWANPATQLAGAAVLHALVNNYMRVPAKRQIYASLGDFTDAYCQPLSAEWADPTSARCLERPDRCTPEVIARRARIGSMSWSELPLPVQALVQSFVRGCSLNPIGGRTDWAAASAGYAPADARNVGGNVFGTNAAAAAGTVRFS